MRSFTDLFGFVVAFVGGGLAAWDFEHGHPRWGCALVVLAAITFLVLMTLGRWGGASDKSYRGVR